VTGGLGQITGVLAAVLVALGLAALLLAWLIWRRHYGRGSSSEPTAIEAASPVPETPPSEQPLNDTVVPQTTPSDEAATQQKDGATAVGIPSDTTDTAGDKPPKANRGDVSVVAEVGGKEAILGDEGATSRIGTGTARKGQTAALATTEIYKPPPSPTGSDQQAEKPRTRDADKPGLDNAGKTTKWKTTAPPHTGTGRRPSPENRGGRPRGTATSQTAEGSARREPRPEIICWQDGWQWVLAVQLPEALAEKDGLRVLQGGQVLQRDSVVRDCWRLATIQSDVDVEWRESTDTSSDNVTLHDSECLLFRLTGAERRLGRLARVPSCRGSYLAVVPETWTRDAARCGAPPVRDEATSIPGWRAHFFDLTDASPEIAFRKPDGQSAVMRAKSPKFDLVGNTIKAILEDHGPFFADGSPRIRAIDADGWSKVGTIVIGEEGGGPRRWRMAFTPQADQIEQDLPPELSAKQAGWYFVRLYDEHGDLLESFDFRFANGLRDVAVDCEPLPSTNRHSKGKVTIRHADDWHIECAASNQHPLSISTEGDHTTIEVAACPDRDRVHWRITSPRGAAVEAASPVGWLWWSLGEEEAPESWNSCAIALDLQDFRAASKKAVFIRLPAAGWTDVVRVGFTDGEARPYRPKIAARDIVVPLREFTDAPELMSPGIWDLSLWVGPGLQTIVLGQVVVPEPPRPHAEKRRKHVCAKVYTGSGQGRKRNGKGFSRQELRESGMTSHDACRLGVPLDGRRKSGHTVNIEVLRELLSEDSKHGDQRV